MNKGIYLFIIVFSMLAACEPQPGTFEKNISIPGHAWSNQFQPTINFSIEDTISSYRIFIVIRHSDAYRYKNIWMNIGVQPPGDSTYYNRRNLTLANDSKGWLGSGMDDIYEHRILLNAQPYKFPRKGSYQFILQQIMREDPLENVLDAGIRIEKVTEP
jgi:gliding motility-associated lipoprotein GldH